jgi:site-specific recombinase XerD
MLKLNLAVTINKQRPDKNGKCQIRIRSTIKRKVSYYNTGISVRPDQFKNGEIVKNPNKSLLNLEIRQQLAEIERRYLEGNISVQLKKSVDFHSYATKKIEQQKSSLANGTYIHKKSYHKKLKDFRPALQFSEINPSFMLDYENYCRSLGNKPTTIWGSLKFIRSIVNAALIDNIIQANPLKAYKQKAYQNPERHFLTEKEIDEIEKFVKKKNTESLINVANWFLFACYTGLRYEDVRDFEKKYIINDRIILRTGKTKSDVSIKVHPKLKAVIERLKSGVISNAKMNMYLKIVAERCNIEKNLTFHLARHTFAVYFLNRGGSIETLSKLLGHNNTRTTLIYGKITNIRIDNEMEKVWH